MRLNALTAPTIQKVVRMQSSHGGMPEKNGTMWNPARQKKNAPSATATCPASFTTGGRPNLSSARPTATRTAERPIKRQMTSFE